MFAPLGLDSSGWFASLGVGFGLFVSLEAIFADVSTARQLQSTGAQTMCCFCILRRQRATFAIKNVNSDILAENSH